MLNPSKLSILLSDKKTQQLEVEVVFLLNKHTHKIMILQTIVLHEKRDKKFDKGFVSRRDVIFVTKPRQSEPIMALQLDYAESLSNLILF